MNGRSLLIRGEQTAVYRMTSDEDAADFINAVTAGKRRLRLSLKKTFRI